MAVEVASLISRGVYQQTESPQSEKNPAPTLNRPNSPEIYADPRFTTALFKAIRYLSDHPRLRNLPVVLDLGIKLYKEGDEEAAVAVLKNFEPPKPK